MLTGVRTTFRRSFSNLPSSTPGKGVFKQAEYNAILRCLHPDAQPSVEQKDEAFRLVHEKRLVLLSAKEETKPTTYPPLPTAEELLKRRK